jgi:hypothetical protein
MGQDFNPELGMMGYTFDINGQPITLYGRA